MPTEKSAQELKSERESRDNYSRAIDTLTLVVIAMGLYFAYDQARQFNQNQNLSNWSDVSARTYEVDRVFVDNPEYQKYFLDGVDIAPGDKDYPKALSISVLILDYLDSFNVLLDYNHDLISDGILQQKAWKHYFTESFKKSPLLCRTLMSDPDSYGPQLQETGIPICKQTFPTLNQAKH
jgi:hypothetical protein